jgi:hypothetical protein
VEFWNWAIRGVKEKFPEVEFYAEIYNPDLYKVHLNPGGFDYLYDKVGLYDTLRKILVDNAPARLITYEWQKLDGLDDRMLRFMENHDEQRIASTHFASDPRLGFPAMGISCLMHKGPVMIYFGQESGEPANGDPGFSGDDGKTSIYDYCHVPEHNKWVNNGQFDGGQLSESQIGIRSFYKKLLHLSRESVFAKGDFYDLMWFNNDNNHFDGRYIYAFLRYKAGMTFLVVANFNKTQPVRVQLKFPHEVWDLLGVNSHFSVFGRDKLWDQKQFFSDSAEFLENGLVIVCEASSVYAFDLEITTD